MRSLLLLLLEIRMRRPGHANRRRLRNRRCLILGNISLELWRRRSRLGEAVAGLEMRRLLVVLTWALGDLVLWKRILVTHEGRDGLPVG